MRELRASILDGTFVQYVQNFFIKQYPAHNYPQWAVDALRSVDIELLSSQFVK